MQCWRRWWKWREERGMRGGGEREGRGRKERGWE